MNRNLVACLFIVCLCLCTAAILILWLALFSLPEWMANQYHHLDAKDWAAQVAANRTILVNLLGGIAVACTIYFTYGNFKIAQDNLKTSEANVRATQDRSITDAFSKAIELLGNADMSVRLGGIHSLARIARSSEADYFPVMQVLTGFLRNKYREPVAPVNEAVTSPGYSRCPVEVQAIFTILGERYWPNPGGYELDLSYVHVCDAWLPDAKFHNVYFWHVNLTGCNFSGSKLNDADFKGAILKECDFTDADLTNANFEAAEILSPKGLTQRQLYRARNVSKDLFEGFGKG